MGEASLEEVALGLDDAATIPGWTKGRVEQIAARDISAEATGLAAVE